MMSNCLPRWRGSDVVLTGGALATAVLTAAAIGIGAADAPTALQVPPTPVQLLAFTPADLLDDAVADFTKANGVLSGIDVTAHPAFASFIDAQISTQDSVLSSIATLQSSEELISNNDAPVGFLVNAYFTVFNLGWYLDGQAALSMDQAFDAALANSSAELGNVLATLDQYGLYVFDIFQLFGEALDSFSINFASLFF